MTVQETCLDKIYQVIDAIHYETMPEDVIVKAKECLADFMGIFINGTKKKTSQDLREALKKTLFTDPESLALWLGSTGRMLDTDDGHRFAMAHPGVAINSTALAMSWYLGNITGKQMIEAIVKAYEIYCYQGRVINPSAYLKRGVDATCVCGSAAAATVTGSLLGFDEKQMKDAISLAASLAGGLNQSAIDGSAQKYLVAGWGAKSGISAAKLARHGLGGPCRVFEGRLGFCNAFSPDPDTEYLNNPKLVWDIRSVYMKRYACVRRIHATLDAIVDILKKEKVDPAEIQKIDVYGSQFLYDAGGYDPKDMAQAQTSVPYAVAILLKYGQVEDQLMHDNIPSLEISQLSRIITVYKDPEIIALAEKDKSLWGAAKVEITLKDGMVYRGKQITPYGDPELPLPAGAVEEKFMKNAAEIVGEDYAKFLWHNLENLEEVADVQSLLYEMLNKVGGAYND